MADTDLQAVFNDLALQLPDDIPEIKPEPMAIAQELRTHPATTIHSDFDPKFAFDVALQYEPLPVVMQLHGITKDEMIRLKSHKPFLIAVKKFRDDIKVQGVGFKMKAKLLAEDLLDDAYLMSRNPDTPSSVRMKGIENVVRWAEYEPKKGSDDSTEGTQFNIQINL